MAEISSTGYRISVEGARGARATVRLAGRLALADLKTLMAELQAIPGRLEPRKHRRRSPGARAAPGWPAAPP